MVEEKVIISGMMAIMMVAVLAQFVQAAPPPPAAEFYCPYCGQGFNTLEELINHVATEHPDQPPIQSIDIVWT